MIQATQLKRGMCIKHDNDLWRVVEAQHKTPGNLRGHGAGQDPQPEDRRDQ